MSSWRIFLAGLLCISYVFSGGKIVRADSSANPLDAKIERREPVIPAGYGKRELSSFEKYRIEKTIEELDRAARINLEQGKEDAAFKLWYRRLKLARALDTEAEITALGEVGAIAWKENRGEDLRNIADRLIAIQDKLTSQDLSPDLLDNFATAYRQIRYLDKAVNIYQQILVNSREQDDAIAERKNLTRLGELYLARFDDRQAAKIYRELLSSTDSQKEPKLQTTYLDRLIDIYDRTSQTSKALTTRKRLLELYAKSQPDKLVGLEIAIANDYQTLNQTEKAIQAYERASTMALQTQRLATASDALTELSELYQKTGSIDRAIATYLKLLKIQQKSYDRYGAIDTYDTLGKIHLDLGQKAQAQQYFEGGLNLAESLDYKVKYFRDRLDSLRESNSVK